MAQTRGKVVRRKINVPKPTPKPGQVDYNIRPGVTERKKQMEDVLKKINGGKKWA